MDGSDGSSVWNYLVTSASSRWLCAEEIFIALFADQTLIGSSVSNGFVFSSQFEIPRSGSLYILSDRNALKDDKVKYAKKKNTDRVQETYQTIKLNGAEEIRGVYARAEDPRDSTDESAYEKDVSKPVLKRRVYRLLQKQAVELLLVHYRECPEDERVERHTLNPQLFELYHTLYTTYTKQRATAESQAQQLSQQHLQQFQYSQQQQMSQYPSFSTFQQDYSNIKSDMTMQGLPPHPQYPQQGYQYASQGLTESFSNGSHTTAPTRSLDDFDTFDPEMMDDLMDFLDQESTNSTLNSALNSGANSFSAHLQASPLGTGAPQRRMTGENMPLPQMETHQDRAEVHTYHHNQGLSPAQSQGYNHSVGHTSHGGFAYPLHSASPATSVPSSLAPSPHVMYSKNIAPHNQSPSMSTAPAVSATQMLVISDFSPSQDHQLGGGTKVLICLANEIAEPFRQHTINIHFGDFHTRFFVKARAEFVSPSVLRCKTPPNTQPGSCQLWIEDEQNALRSMPADQPFEFITPVSIGSVTTSRVTVASKLGKRSNFRDSAMRVDATATTATEPAPASPYGYRLPAHFANSILRRSSPLRGDSVSHSDFDKEHKIRIVEKLGTMKYALTHEDPPPGGAGASANVLDSAPLVGYTGRLTPRGQAAPAFAEGSDHHATHDGVKWLDDQELSEMSTEELEVLMDRYIMVVVKQLVQLAVMDDDLKAEIDSLDSSGFSLLHYCCLYNLNSLIPVLLARGADVNRRNSTGSTALHLAAASGHLAVVQVLVESGAVVDSCDANNVLPSDAAYEAGYMDIYNLLLALENVEMDTSSTPVLAAPEVTTEMHDANAQMLYGSSPVSSHNIAFLPTAPLPGSLGPLTFSPVASAKTRTEVPSLKFDSPPPAFPGEIFDPSVSLDGSNALSNKLLQEAFASLSLTDKCALSLASMGQLNSDGSKKLPASNSGATSATSTPRTRTLSKVNINSPLEGPPMLTASALASAANLSLSDEMSEIQSVLSETDQESLQKAMSMMRHSELEQVEAEVRTIQNNVRGWILRKNYTNLREAARVLQVAWREKKRNALTHSDHLTSTPSSRGTDSPSALSIGVSSAPNSAKLSTSSGSPSNAAHSHPSSGAFGLVDPNRAQLQAAATLQAATRGMLARRSFSSVRKQTMASLVIQKSLVKWWEHNKVGAQGSPAKPVG